LSIVGIFDWGIGGFGVYNALKQKTPQLPVVYFSDAGFMPYGKVDKKTLHSRVLEVEHWLLNEQKCTDVLWACNAASSALTSEALATRYNILNEGIAAAIASKSKHIGVLGGVATIESHLFQNAIQLAGKQCTAVVAQPLSAHVETGCTNQQQLHLDLARVTAPLANCDAVVMACTHYPVLLPEFQKLLPKTEWIDPAETLVASFLDKEVLTSSARTDAFYTTGSVDNMQTAVLKAYGKVLPELKAAKF